MKRIFIILIVFIFIFSAVCMLTSRVQASQAQTLSQTGWLDKTSSNKAPSGFDPLARLPMTLLYLVVVCLLAYIILKFLGSRNLLLNSAFSKNKLIRVIEKHTLGPKQALYIIELAGKYLLIGFADNNVNTLAELNSDEIEAVLTQRKEKAESDIKTPQKFWETFFKKRLPFTKK